MRTRRSPHNQEVLFRALFKPPAKAIEVPQIRTPEEIDAMWWLPKASRNLMKRDAARRVKRPAK